MNETLHAGMSKRLTPTFLRDDYRNARCGTALRDETVVANRKGEQLIVGYLAQARSPSLLRARR
jgi:hypothetical protein